MKLFKRKPPEPLRTCVYCGGVPRLIKCGDHREFVVYQCSRCYETPVRLDEARMCEAAARSIWNKRTDDAEYVLNTFKRVRASTAIVTCKEP